RPPKSDHTSRPVYTRIEPRTISSRHAPRVRRPSCEERGALRHGEAAGWGEPDVVDLVETFLEARGLQPLCGGEDGHFGHLGSALGIALDRVGDARLEEVRHRPGAMPM